MTQLYIDVPIPTTGPPSITINTGDTPTTLIELALSAEDLINADVLSKSGMFIRLFEISMPFVFRLININLLIYDFYALNFHSSSLFFS